MKIMLFGASGRTGQQVLLQALALGHDVTAVVRQPGNFRLAYNRLTVTTGDALRPESFASALVGQDVVISVLGVTGLHNSLRPMTFHANTAHGIIAWMKKHRVARFIGVTSVGVLDDPTTPLWYRAVVKPLLRHKYADMRRMEQLVCGSGLDWTLVRPVRLIDGSLTQHYRIGADGTVAHGTAISRADAADFLVRRAIENSYVNRAVALSY